MPAGDNYWLDREAFEMVPGGREPRPHDEAADHVAFDFGKGTLESG